MEQAPLHVGFLRCRLDLASRGAGGCPQAALVDAVLVVGFGTSFDESCHITIGAIESVVREAFPECDVRRAFTAQF